jgi:PleD family two-component response regulator
VSDEETKQKIFIVEDDTDLSDMLTAYFRVQGYDVSNATRGEDAVRDIIAEAPDIVVLDIRLPDIDGYEVCRRMRRSRRTRSVPVIFLTEKREREDKLSGLELGAVDYITKPFDIQELRLRIRNALRRSRLNSMVNPVTGLPEGPIVQEKLEEMLMQPDWGIVLAELRGLNKFRDRFGFVAADDVSRAVTLMITKAVQESTGGEDFVGHGDTGDFIVITSSDRSKQLADRCRMRLQPSIQYFYPAIERQRVNDLPESERLTVNVVSLSSRDGQVSDFDALLAALSKA